MYIYIYIIYLYIYIKYIYICVCVHIPIKISLESSILVANKTPGCPSHSCACRTPHKPAQCTGLSGAISMGNSREPGSYG